MAQLLSVSSLSFSYGRAKALQDVNVAMEDGQIVSVIGPNGAGKTTLVNAIMGLNGPVSTVMYCGRLISDWSIERRVRAGITMVPERRELFAHMSVADNLALGGFPRFLSGGGSADRLEEIFQLFPRLRERKHQYAATLSGGEQQMLALGRALMSKPRLMILDEPSLGLAPLIIADMFKIISQLRRTGVSVLLIEQNARAALKIADYGYLMESGEVVLHGPSYQLFSNSHVVDTYLGATKDRVRSDDQDEPARSDL